MEAPEALASSTSGVIGEPFLAVNTPRERKMTFLSSLDMGMCITLVKRPQFQAFCAVQLFAAAEALREKANTPMTPDEQTYFDEQLNALREIMDSTKFDLAWSKGHALTMDQAIELAL